MSEVKVNKLSPRSGTTVTLGDSGDTISIPSGVTLSNAGTNSFASATITGDLTVDTDTFTVNSSTDRVGIGVSSPSVPLEILTNLSSDTQSTPETVLTLATKYSSTGADGAAGSGSRLEFEIPDDETNPITGAAIAGLKENSDDSSAEAALAFYTSQNDTTLDEAMRITSDGDVLVAKTSADISTVGIELDNVGRIGATRSGNITGLFNRLSSDGEIVRFQKDGTTIGSIGNKSSYVFMSNSSSDNTGFKINPDAITPSTATGTDRDNAIDLGASSSRYKDLYLSGGLYVGGTGSANHLDDYEEGTWTPTTNIGYSAINNAYYVKTGRMVLVHMDVVTNAGPGDGSQATSVSGLPFSGKSGDQISGSNIIKGLNQDVYAEVGGTSFAQRDRADDTHLTRGEYGNRTHRCTIIYYTDS